MKIKKIQIKNYKSVLDSSEISIEDKLTIFVGKNESGKTNVLKAIRDIDNIENNKALCPNHDENNKPYIKIITELNATEEAAAERKFGMDLKIKNLIFHTYSDDSNKVTLPTDTYNIIKQQLLKTFNTEFKTKYSFVFSDDEKIDFGKEDEELQSKLEIKYKELKSEYDKIIEDLVAYVFTLIPTITYLSVFENTLPKQINSSNIESQPIKFLAAFVNKESKGRVPANIFETILKLSADQAQTKASKCSEVSRVLTKFFCDNYKQYKLKFDLLPIGNNIEIYVKDFVNENGEHEEGMGLYLDERSTGLNWYISFIIACNSLNSNEIFVLDEPGVYLHLEGQNNMLEWLKTLAEERQIIICTHSPYLIDTTSLNIVRLVEKQRTKFNDIIFEETKVISRLHDYKDQATIQTLSASIGYNITRGLSIHKEKALIVEGVSDLLLLQAFYKKVNRTLNFDVFYAKTSSKADVMDSLLFGLGVKKIVLLYDADNAGVRSYKDLPHRKINSVFTHIVPENVLNGNGRLTTQLCIEDVLSQNDFIRSYLNGQTVYVFDSTKTNSQNAKDKASKYLDSKLFLENIDTFTFDSTTMTNINALIGRIEEKFNYYQ